MKKKVYFVMFSLIICFLAGGWYITRSINDVTDRLETIITLNKVEFLRETLLNRIVVVQADLLLKDTPHARQVDTFVQHVEEMRQAANHCLECHHREEVKSKILTFEEMIDRYVKKLSRVYTLRANEKRLKAEKQSAFDLGQATLDVVNRVVITSQHKTSQRIQKARQNIRESERLLYGLMIFGPLVIILFTFYFFRNFTTSVISLANATSKIKEGQLSYRIKDQLNDEFRDLAVSFNEMANSLKEHQEKIQQAERLAAVGELAAGLAHEIKNPLAGIKVSIEVLKNDLDLEQEDKEIFLRVINEIQRIESLLKNLLNYARPGSPKFDNVNLHDIVETILKTSEFSLNSSANGSCQFKNINFIREYDKHIERICADGEQLKQVLLNLILNSCDAITDKGTITIKTTKISDEFVEIRVADTGKGIDPKAAEMVFNPFFTTKSKGSGLGLAICKRLVEQHNGSIKVMSNPEGGATFSITLPLKQENDRCQT